MNNSTYPMSRTLTSAETKRASALLNQVCAKHDVEPGEVVMSQVQMSRAPGLVRARYEYAYLLRQDGFSYPAITVALGYRSHASAMEACRVHAARMKKGGAA